MRKFEKNKIVESKNFPVNPFFTSATITLFTENLSHVSKMDSLEKIFLDSSVDFGGESTGTSF